MRTVEASEVVSVDHDAHSAAPMPYQPVDRRQNSPRREHTALQKYCQTRPDLCHLYELMYLRPKPAFLTSIAVHRPLQHIAGFAYDSYFLLGLKSIILYLSERSRSGETGLDKTSGFSLRTLGGMDRRACSPTS